MTPTDTPRDSHLVMVVIFSLYLQSLQVTWLHDRVMVVNLLTVTWVVPVFSKSLFFKQLFYMAHGRHRVMA